MYWYTVKFLGRKAGSIGITYPIAEMVYSENTMLDSNTLQLKLYEIGYEHISKLELVSCGVVP